MPEIVRLEKAPHEPLTSFSGQRVGEVVGTVALPIRDHLNAATTSSLLFSNFGWLHEQGQTVHFQLMRGNALPFQRNECINRMQGDWILFVDDDMVWDPKAIEQLVKLREEHDFDMLGGLCFRRAAPYQPTLYMRERPNDGYYNFLESWREGEIVEVDATGMAFVVIHKRVFEMMIGGPMPPYELRRQMGGPPPNIFRWDGTLGEDLRFCQEAKAAGVRIYVATGIEVGHMAEVEIRHRDFLAQLAQRDQATYLARVGVNDAMGLPTLAPEEAKERLGW